MLGTLRVLPVVLLCPVLGGQLVPPGVRLAVAGALGLAVRPLAGPVAGVSVELWARCAREAQVGLLLGLAAALPFDGARIGGRLIDLVRGTSAEAALPGAGHRESATGEVLHQILVSLALAGGALPAMLRALGRSYLLLPPGSMTPGPEGALALAGLLGTALAIGLSIAAPVVALSWATDAAVGLALRAAPGLPIGEIGRAGPHPRRSRRALALARRRDPQAARVGALARRRMAGGARPMSADRTEEPTPRRLRQARERGQVPRSRLLSGSLVLAGGSAGAAAGLGGLTGELRAWTAALLLHGGSWPSMLHQASLLLACACAPALGGAALAAAVAGLAASGWAPSSAVLVPRLDRIDPLAGLRRIVSWRMLWELGRSLLVAALLLAVLAAGAWTLLPPTVRLPAVEAPGHGARPAQARGDARLGARAGARSRPRGAGSGVRPPPPPALAPHEQGGGPARAPGAGGRSTPPRPSPRGAPAAAPLGESPRGERPHRWWW